MSAGTVSSGEDVSMPLNVVFAGNFLYPQGMAGTKRVQYFIDSVVIDAGSSARVLLFRQGHKGRNDSRLAGKHHGIPYVTIGHEVRLDWWLPISLVRYVWRGCALLRKWRAPAPVHNVLFLYGEPNLENAVFVLFAKLSGYKIVVDIVEDSYQVARNAPIISRLKAWTVRLASRRMHWFADGIIVISTHLLQKFSKINRSRYAIQLIPVSVNLDRLPYATGAFHKPVRVFYAGSFAKKDSVENLIDAFEVVASKHPGIELLLSGKGMDDRMQSVQQKISASPVKDKIHYLGYLSNQDYFSTVRDCDIPCVVRATTEFAERGFPFKLGEYLATGRPVIASAVGDIPDYLVDRKSAFLVKAGSIASVAQAIEYLILNEDEALKVGRAGRLVAEEHFDAVKNGARFIALLQRLN